MKYCVVFYFVLWTTSLGAEDRIEILGKKRSKPNVIIVAIDTLRADHLGCYGYDRSTSTHIDAFAEEGVLFEQCYSTAPWTLPSFMSVFTGVLPSVHQVYRIESVRPLSDSIPTLAEAFQEAGYFCGAVVCNPYVSGRYGFYRGFDIYDEYSVFMDTFTSGVEPNLLANPGITRVRSGRYVMECAGDIMKNSMQAGKPLFLFVLLYDCHDEYIAPYEICTRFGIDYDSVTAGHGLADHRNSIPEGRELETLINLYDSEIAYVDQQFGELVKAIESYSPREDTLTILISDHGEAFGEHDVMLHSNNLHREETHVPMIWRWPGVIARGYRIESPVSLLDISKTLGELFLFGDSSHYQGQTLWPGLFGRPLREDRLVYGEHGQDIAIAQGRYRWHLQGGKHLLFDWMNDPLEQVNLIDSVNCEIVEAFERSYQKIQEQCLRLTAEFGSRQTIGTQTIELSEDEKNRLKSLGYVE